MIYVIKQISYNTLLIVPVVSQTIQSSICNYFLFDKYIRQWHILSQKKCDKFQQNITEKNIFLHIPYELFKLNSRGNGLALLLFTSYKSLCLYLDKKEGKFKVRK